MRVWHPVKQDPIGDLKRERSCLQRKLRRPAFYSADTVTAMQSRLATVQKLLSDADQNTVNIAEFDYAATLTQDESDLFDTRMREVTDAAAECVADITVALWEANKA